MRSPSAAGIAAVLAAAFRAAGASAAPAPCPNIEAYGGSPRSADNSAALRAALAAAAPSLCASIPPGRFVFAAPVIVRLRPGAGSATLTGAGADVTELTWPGGGGLAFSFVGPDNSVHIRDLALTTATVGQGTALVLDLAAGQGGSPADNALSDIAGVTIRGADGYAVTDYWQTGIALRGVSNVNLTGLNVTGPGGAGYASHGQGLLIAGAAATPSVVFNVSGASFDYLQKGIVYGDYVQGLTVTQSNFTGDTYGIFVPANLQNLDQLAVSDSQFNCALAGVSVASYLSDTLFSSNLFIVPNTGVGISLAAAYIYSAVGNAFNDGSARNTATHPIGIEIGPSSGGGSITGNLFNSMTTAILLDAGSSGANVQSNDYAGNTANVKDEGQGNKIGGGSP
jgi:hypothetical protein